MKVCVELVGETLTLTSLEPLRLERCSIDSGIDLSLEEIEGFKEKHNPKDTIIIRVVDDCRDGLHLIEGRIHPEPYSF